MEGIKRTRQRHSNAKDKHANELWWSSIIYASGFPPGAITKKHMTQIVCYTKMDTGFMRTVEDTFFPAKMTPEQLKACEERAKDWNALSTQEQEDYCSYLKSHIK